MDELHVRGSATIAELIEGGDQHVKNLFRIAPDLGQLAVGVVYGHLHHRPALDPRMREAVALATIIASGCTGTPLSVHVRTGLAAGLAPGEIIEILTEVSAFAGIPRAVEALGRITAIFDELGIGLDQTTTPREALLKQVDRPATVVGVDARRAVAVFDDDTVDLYTVDAQGD